MTFLPQQCLTHLEMNIASNKAKLCESVIKPIITYAYENRTYIVKTMKTAETTDCKKHRKNIGTIRCHQNTSEMKAQ